MESAVSKFPLHRFEEFGRLSAAEQDFLAGSCDPPLIFVRDQIIQPEGVPTNRFFLLVSGWAAAAHRWPDGGRQILKVHLPGDALGSPSMCSPITVDELLAVTDVLVIPVPLKRFGAAFERYPRLAARFLLSVQQERVALMDRLASIGRSSAERRVAAFVVDLVERLEPLGLVNNDSFEMLLTQEQIGDALGLTGVHVNRVLRALENRTLISRTLHRYTIHDRTRMGRFAGRISRTRAENPDWLPQLANHRRWTVG